MIKFNDSFFIINSKFFNKTLRILLKIEEFQILGTIYYLSIH